MIVQKFGGSSVADAERMAVVAGIVAAHRERRPVVVVSALGGVTDLVLDAVDRAAADDREGLDAAVHDLERRHRWVLGGLAIDGGRRHALALELDAAFEDLRQSLRSVRILGEVTPRVRDALLAFGELRASRLLVAALECVGVDAAWVDPTAVVRTDDRFGGATPDVDAIRGACAEQLVPLVDAGRVPVIGGFVGSTASGAVTTLGRGGSDTSAAILGAALEVEEIQIWTDVDGLMTADPRFVPEAVPLARATFAEAAELAFYGAKVLHPASIEPAVRRSIPVRILNTRRTEARGTVVVGDDGSGGGIASIANRGGLRRVRVMSPRMNLDPKFLAAVVGVLGRHGIGPDVLAASEIGTAFAAREGPALDRVERDLGELGRVETLSDMAVVCVVGSGLIADVDLRRQVLSAVAELAPDLLALGGSGSSVAALVPRPAEGDAVRALHRRFFVGGG